MTFRELAGDYQVAHTTLSRYFARPDVAKQLKHAEQTAEREARRLATQQPLPAYRGTRSFVIQHGGAA